MRRFAFLVAFLLVPALAPRLAAAEERITLREALERAVKANPTLASEAVDVMIAEAQYLQATGVDDFTIDANANVQFIRTDPVEGQPFQQLATDRVDLGGGITKNFSTGGRVGLSFDNSYQRSLQRFGTDDFESEVWNPRLTVNVFQPILRGFGEDNVARTGLRRARAQRTIEELERANVASNIIRDVVSAYWELAYAHRNLEITRNSLALAKEQLRITQARLDVGVGAPTDLAAVEQTIALREEAVLLAEVAITDRSLEVRQLSGMELNPTAIDLVTSERVDLSATDLTLQEAIDRAYATNPQLAIIKARGDQARLEVSITENGLLPQLDFTASAGPQGNDDDLSSALGQIVTFDTYQVTAGVVFSMPIGNRSAKGARDVAKAQLRKVMVGKADLEAQIGVAAARAVNAVTSARKRLEVLETATRAAQVNLDAEQARFDVGRSTNFDVLQRQDELAGSQLRTARAQIDYLRAAAVLQTLTGDILPAYGVELRKK